MINKTLLLVYLLTLQCGRWKYR